MALTSQRHGCRLIMGRSGLMRIESDGHNRGNPRIYQLIDYLKVAGQPVAGPWPPHQEPRPDPEEDTLPVAVADPQSPQRSPGGPAATTIGATDGGTPAAGAGASEAASTAGDDD